MSGIVLEICSKSDRLLVQHALLKAVHQDQTNIAGYIISQMPGLLSQEIFYRGYSGIVGQVAVKSANNQAMIKYLRSRIKELLDQKIIYHGHAYKIRNSYVMEAERYKGNGDVLGSFADIVSVEAFSQYNNRKLKDSTIVIALFYVARNKPLGTLKKLSNLYLNLE
ncbi:hypothetical protein ACH42_01225 [Endozoicomonas sp. (ex Bugula neritina AB1)]|nr:hypothetical protein ACH42_01225 [Endozoicomonas sp. (ex Bugula neritina AB1)]